MKENRSNLIILLLIIIIILLLGFIGLMIIGKVSFNQDIDDKKDNNEILKDNEDVTYNVDDYVSVEKVDFGGERVDVEKVVFKNLDNELVKEFVSEQDRLLQDAKNNYEFCKDGTDCGIDESVVLSTSDIWYQINDKILTVHYEMFSETTIGSGSGVAVINIDLEKKKVISDEELLKMVGSSFNDVALEHYNNTLEKVKECNESSCTVIDKDYNDMKLEVYIDNKDNYINSIVFGLDDAIHCYIEDGIVKYDCYKVSIDTLYLGTPIGGPFPIYTVEVGEL